MKNASSLAELDPLEREALAVLAAYQRPCSRTQLAKVLSQAGVRQAPSDTEPNARRNGRVHGRALTAVELTPIVERWLQQGQIVVVDGEYTEYVCTPEVAHAVLSDPSCQPMLMELRKNLQPDAERAFYGGRSTTLRYLQLARLAMYCGAPQAADHEFEQAVQSTYSHSGFELYEALLDPRAPVEALELMSPSLRAAYLEKLLESAASTLRVPSLAMLAASASPVAVMLAAISGETRAADVWLGEDASELATEARALVALVRGDFASARSLTAGVITHATSKRRAPKLTGPLAPLLTLALATGSAEHVAAARLQL